MNILMVNHNGLATNSGIHVANLAKGLVDLGVSVGVAVPDAHFADGNAAFGYLSWSTAENYRFADGAKADLIHGWTPRQHVAAATRRLASLHGCRYLVHLEDNEHAITAAYLGLTVPHLVNVSAQDPGFSVPDSLAHPVDMRHFLEHAFGVTALIDRLLEFKPAATLGLELWPSAENEVFSPREADVSLRNELGIGTDTKVLVYHGNVHPANVGEVRSLYLAIAALVRRGMDIVLVRLGTDYAQVITPELQEVEQRVIKIPFQPRERLPLYLSLADVFVQPGRVDEFNAYRFPSKLPEFMAMARPVILPATNVGNKIVDGEEGFLLHKGDALEIAEAIRRVLLTPALARRLASGARRFFERELSWSKSAAKLLGFYESALDRVDMDDLSDDVAARSARKRYGGYPIATPLSYATVRDYSDSVKHLGALTRINHDLKDAQRPWVFKAILASLPRGGRLLEIGAGDPWVADLLSRLGYEVVIIDPYDGTARGPDQFDAIKAQFPHIKFVRGFFPDALDQLSDRTFDCIYSISVLEHLPMDAVKTVFSGIAQHSRSTNSPTIHAIDHVLLGHGAQEHFDKLEKMVQCLGLRPSTLSELLRQLENDPDAYFLSAEAHNLWRGATPYEDFPMRRCVSIQICSTATGEALPALAKPHA